MRKLSISTKGLFKMNILIKEQDQEEPQVTLKLNGWMTQSTFTLDGVPYRIKAKGMLLRNAHLFRNNEILAESTAVGLMAMTYTFALPKLSFSLKLDNMWGNKWSIFVQDEHVGHIHFNPWKFSCGTIEVSEDVPLWLVAFFSHVLTLKRLTSNGAA